MDRSGAGTGLRRVCLARREFVGLVAGLPAALLGASCASLAPITVRPEGGRFRLEFEAHPELLEPGGHVAVRPEGERTPIYVLALADGGHAAVSPICTHQGCTVDIAGRQLVCPCHGSMYEFDGTVVRGPAPRSLHRYVVDRTATGLTIDLGRSG